MVPSDQHRIYPSQKALYMLPVTQPQLCFHITASPNDKFYSQIAMFRLALDSFGGIYKNAHIILALGGKEFVPLPDRWKPYLGNNIRLNWAEPHLFAKYSYASQGNARWKYNYDGYDIVILCDADTLLIQPIDDVVTRMQTSPAVMGVIAHYPFTWQTEQDNEQVWSELAKDFIGKPIDLKYKYTLLPHDDPSSNSPFYINYGFVALTPQIIKTLASTFLDLRPRIMTHKDIKHPVFSGQISLALSVLLRDVPTHELGLRYNYPNDPIADQLHPEELEDVRLIHYLRTDRFERHTIFATEEAFYNFLSLDLEGSNKVFQEHVRKLTNGKYPFKLEQPALPQKREQGIMEPNDKKVIVVLGMHRSGTSAMTRSLQILGVGLGDNLHPAGFDNPKGFWEDQDCIAINEELLSHVGSAYDRLGGNLDINMEDPVVQSLYLRAVNLVSENIAENQGVWGVKDPRMCRLLGFWKKVFDECGCDVSYVLSLRNPISVAESLNRRNGIPPEKSHLLWLQHMVPALIETQGERRVVVDYDLIMESPTEQVMRISDALRMPLGEDSEQQLKEFSESFLERGLRHSKHSLDQVSQDPSVSSDTFKAYELLFRAARDEVSIDSNEVQAGFEKLDSNLQAYGPAFTYANLLEDQRTDLYHTIADNNTKLAERDTQIGELHTHMAVLNTQILELHTHATNLNTQVSDLTTQVIDLYTHIASRDTQITNLNTQIADLQHSVAERDNKIASNNQTIHELSQQLAAIRSSTAWNIGSRITRAAATLFPHGTRRERFARLSMQAVRTWRHEGLKATFQKTAQKVKQVARNRLFPVQVNTVESTSATKDLYVPINQFDVDPASLLVKPIAFYLPQFHPIPENDAWWGKGFTEWTNVTKARPNFEGHYQPHVPDELLGYYDLRQPDVQKRQVEIAKKYGIYGFCFYYYWFAGKRLLERPVDQYLANPDLDLPFCLCWANENWTRRWDGAEHEILIGQTHNEQEYLHFIQDISLHFKDPRYIRVDGKPVLLVYRINLLPDPEVAAQIWREECKRSGIGDIYLIAVQSFGITDPRPYGFDAAVEFPPSYLGAAEISPNSLTMTNPEYKGRIFDYNSAANLMIDRKADGYTLFKTVMLSWDNTARRQNESHIFVNATPESYKNWLEKVVAYTRKHLPEDKRFVFVNAWNEWAEGTHLEPDRRYGYAYLQATTEAIQDSSSAKFTFPPGWKILFVSHDANKGGSQAALLSTLGWFKEHTSLSLKVLCLEGGVLLPDFEALADTIVLSELAQATDGNTEGLTERLLDFCNGKPDLIYGNTVVAGKAYGWLDSLGVPILTHAYELEMSIQRYAADCIADVIQYSSHYITPSNAVKDNLVKNHAVDANKITVVYGAVSNEPLTLYQSLEEKKPLRNKLGLDSDKLLIFGCGLGMPFRKGADLFIELGETLRKRGHTNFHLYWVGGFQDTESDPTHGSWADHIAKLAKNHLSDFVTFLGFKENFREYFQAADIFVLPSREDPLPLVAIEAAKCGLPLICFADAGGTPDLVGEDAGFVVPFEDVGRMTEKTLQLMKDSALRTAMGRRAREKFLSQFTVERTTPNILSTCRKVANQRPAVSVIVPNYNHAKYLPERLDSIFNQTFQDFEVILLDDASADNSMEVLEQYSSYGDVRVHKNTQNSGTPFKQWLVGLDMARADIIWIAESDDICKPELLESLLPAFRDPAVKLAYVNSDVIDENSRVIGDYSSDQAKYLATLSSTKWKKNYVATANQEMNDGLGVKNTILNASAVLFRKFEMPSDFRETLEKMRIAGDWYFYAHAIKDGKVYYDARKWNSHRRHSSSVIAQTVSEGKIRDFFREFSVVQKYIFHTYRLDNGFKEKWETYLLQQLREFSTDASYEGLSRYYPLEEMQTLLAEAQFSSDPTEKISASA